MRGRLSRVVAPLSVSVLATMTLSVRDSLPRRQAVAAEQQDVDPLLVPERIAGFGVRDGSALAVVGEYLGEGVPGQKGGVRGGRGWQGDAQAERRHQHSTDDALPGAQPSRSQQQVPGHDHRDPAQTEGHDCDPEQGQGIAVDEQPEQPALVASNQPDGSGEHTDEHRQGKEPECAPARYQIGQSGNQRSEHAENQESTDARLFAEPMPGTR